jgi:uncharacterized protein
MPSSYRIMFWQRLDAPGSEYCTLDTSATGWLFDSTVLLALNDTPMHMRYHIACDDTWQTRAVEISSRDGTEDRTLRLTVDAEQRWWIDSSERADLRGCVDVDLTVTPATNTLPIRRLSLSIGAEAEIAAAWLNFPDLTITRSVQHYTRLTAQRYRYESGTYRTEIDVDDFGLVTHYPDGWERVILREFAKQGDNRSTA